MGGAKAAYSLCLVAGKNPGKTRVPSTLQVLFMVKCHANPRLLSLSDERMRIVKWQQYVYQLLRNFCPELIVTLCMMYVY